MTLPYFSRIAWQGLVVGMVAATAGAADGLKSRTSHAEAYGPTKNTVAVDPAKDLPRYPAVEPKKAAETWVMKDGFQMELAAHEPLVRDPIALCFDERGRMFVCEMIDYSEMRDVVPHLGRISMLEDKDGDGHFETASVFADNLPWPTGLIWSQGGLYVGATPDIWRFEDKDGDGRAEVREKVFTGFGTGLKILNVQGLMNSFQWGGDNRIHILAGGGNRGKIRCLKRPELPEIELGGRDFWFDPLTLEFGLEAGGAQYGMSFDNYGRKFGCSNSDHLQHWGYDSRYAGRNAGYSMPPARQSIAVDGGAAEVFRLSPDEPWRIIRTRWRIAGVVKGAVEGGGRVSGYFTGATGTTIYRGDAYGEEFVNNSFTGDAGGQLVHRKIIREAENGIDLVGERPQDERGVEFAASPDTWVRVVNFANAPDGHLYVCDMYREIIEHPWAVPDEIKKHLDLNSGNDRGRVWRITKSTTAKDRPERRTRPALDKADTETLVKTLAHANGWHRDTAARLLYERQDKAALPQLAGLVESANAPLASLHALNVMSGLKGLTAQTLGSALAHADAHVRERACMLAEDYVQAVPEAADSLRPLMLKLAEKDASRRVRFQALLSLGNLPQPATEAVARVFAAASRQSNDAALGGLRPAVLGAPPALVSLVLQERLRTPEMNGADLLPLFETAAASGTAKDRALLLDVLAGAGAANRTAWLKAVATGLRKAGTSIAKADAGGRLDPVFAEAVKTVASTSAEEKSRLEAIELLALNMNAAREETLLGALSALGEAAQEAVVTALMPRVSAHAALLAKWPVLKPTARQVLLTALVARDDSASLLLKSLSEPVSNPGVLPADLTATQVQALVKHKNTQVAELAKTALAAVIPPSREEVVKKFQPALALKGNAGAGGTVFMARCFACHVANGQGIEVGPPMTTVKTRGKDGLLTAILEPHKEVASQYIAYAVSTKDGQTLSGIIARDDAASMTLKMMGGAEVTLQRTNIQGSSSAGLSLMPEGLEQGLSAQDMADLLAFIEAVK